MRKCKDIKEIIMHMQTAAEHGMKLVRSSEAPMQSEHVRAQMEMIITQSLVSCLCLGSTLMQCAPQPGFIVQPCMKGLEWECRTYFNRGQSISHICIAAKRLDLEMLLSAESLLCGVSRRVHVLSDERSGAQPGPRWHCLSVQHGQQFANSAPGAGSSDHPAHPASSRSCCRCLVLLILLSVGNARTSAHLG